MNKPYFYAKIIGNLVKTSGDPYCLLGNRTQKYPGHEAEGVFAGWSWDGKCLSIFNDRYGFYPLFYFHREGEICVSPSLFKLVAEGAPTDFDEAGLSVFLRLGFFIGEDTPFKAIRALPPNAKLVWKEGKLELSGQYSIRKRLHVSYDEAIDMYVSLFKAAIRRTHPPHEDFAVPLSGGRDSRHIILELCESGYRPRFCITVRYYPPRSNSDLEIASELAKSLKLTHILLDQNESLFRAEFRKNLKTNLCTDEHAWVLILADYLEGRVRTIYDGIAGDVLSGGLGLTRQRVYLFEEGRFNDLAAEFLKKEEKLSSLIDHQEYKRFGRELAVNHLVNELEKHAEAPNPVGSILFWNRTRREIALSPYSILNEELDIVSPYLDHELYDFLASLPASFLLHKRFHSDAISRGYPQYGSFPYEKLKDIDSTDVYCNFARELACFMLSKRLTNLLNNYWLVPRLLRCLVSPSYSKSMAEILAMILYIYQLEMVARPR